MVRMDNVEQLAGAYSGTLQIPSREMRVRLRKGDIVKLHFREDGTEGGERMWVKVQSGSDRGYMGLLDSDPTRLIEIKAGDRIGFGPEHVASIWIDADHDWDARLAAPPVLAESAIEGITHFVEFSRRRKSQICF